MKQTYFFILFLSFITTLIVSCGDEAQENSNEQNNSALLLKN